jgi:hypothetical protein
MVWSRPNLMKRRQMAHAPPSVKESAFSCPYCLAFAHQHWTPVFAQRNNNSTQVAAERSVPPELVQLSSAINTSVIIRNTFVSRCANCQKAAIWVGSTIVFPRQYDALPANPDMSPDVRRDYDEASAILEVSPRGAAALLRLGIQKLCKELGQPGKNINDDIGALVRAGLDVRIQQALDVVRVIGNSAVHPGQIDLRDDRGTAESLFRLLNLIVDKTISEPKHVKDMFDALPESQRKAIEKRDATT